MTAIFEKHGVQFMYPENWTLGENNESEDFIEVSLESPGGSFWSVSIFDSSTSPQNLLDSCADALDDHYEDFERINFAGQIGKWNSIGFDSHFYCLDFLVTAKARVFDLENKTLNVFCQAESREFDKVEEVFNAITLSLLKSVDE